MAGDAVLTTFEHVCGVLDDILQKLVAGRMIDRADSSMLLRENRDAVNREPSGTAQPLTFPPNWVG